MKAPYDENYFTCPKCNGSGWDEEFEAEMTKEVLEALSKEEIEERKCDLCDGEGEVEEEVYKDYCYDLVDWDERNAD